MSSLGLQMKEKTEKQFVADAKSLATSYAHELGASELFSKVEIPEELKVRIYGIGRPSSYSDTWLSVATPEDASTLALAIVDVLEDARFEKEFRSGRRVMVSNDIPGVGRIKIDTDYAGERAECVAVYEMKKTIVRWDCPQEGW